jgi:hypothetical protein
MTHRLISTTMELIWELFSGVEVLRSPPRQVVLLGGQGDILQEVPAAECRHRDLSGQQE